MLDAFLFLLNMIENSVQGVGIKKAIDKRWVVVSFRQRVDYDGLMSYPNSADAMGRGRQVAHDGQQR